MAITHDGYSFSGSNIHGLIPGGAFDLPLMVNPYFGLVGESHLIGERTGRDLMCDYVLDGFAGLDDLQAQLDEIDEQQGQLTGDVVFSGAVEVTHPRCTFLGYDRDGEPFYDGSGVNGWVQFGKLKWRQRA